MISHQTIVMPFQGHRFHFSNCALYSTAKCLLKFRYLHSEMLDSIQPKIYPDICWPPTNKAQWKTFYKWGTKTVADISQETWAFVSHFLQLLHSELQSTLSVCAVFLSAFNHFLSLIFSRLSPPTLSLRCSLCNVLVTGVYQFLCLTIKLPLQKCSVDEKHN